MSLTRVFPVFRITLQTIKLTSNCIRTANLLSNINCLIRHEQKMLKFQNHFKHIFDYVVNKAMSFCLYLNTKKQSIFS